MSEAYMDKIEILFETERMLITEFSATYDMGMFEMDSDKEVHRLGINRFTTIEQSRNQIEFIQRQILKMESAVGRY
jgi:hypothetical protein